MALSKKQQWLAWITTLTTMGRSGTHAHCLNRRGMIKRLAVGLVMANPNISDEDLEAFLADCAPLGPAAAEITPHEIRAYASETQRFNPTFREGFRAS